MTQNSLSSAVKLSDVKGSQNLGLMQQSRNQWTVSKAGNGLLANFLNSQSMNHLQKSNFDADISDIDIEFKMEDDEDKQKLVEMNFKESHSLLGKAPFPHWMINRTII